MSRVRSRQVSVEDHCRCKSNETDKLTAADQGCVLVVGTQLVAPLPSAQRDIHFGAVRMGCAPTGGGFGATDWGGLRTAVIALIDLAGGVLTLVALYVGSFIVPMTIQGVEVNLFVSVIASGFTAPYGAPGFPLSPRPSRP